MRASAAFGWCACLAAASSCAPASRTAGDPAPAPAAREWRLPARFVTDRVYVTPVTERGDTLLLYTDTGGGANMLYRPAAERLGLTVEWMRSGRDSVPITRMPPLDPRQAIPLPADLPPFGDRFIVPPPRDSAADEHGFLGRTWFAGRVWRFDYPAGTLTLLPPEAVAAPTAAAAHRVPLGFQTDSAGRRTTHFPRIRVEVDGDSLDLLFDTGAMAHLTDAARAALADGGPAVRGSSFIAENVFTRWRRRHPDWRVIERADRTLDMPMIEVPRVSVAGHAVGPVWFAMRPDRNFHSYMSQWMDRRVEGALGGSALRYFRVTVDYPGAAATFER